MFRKDIYKYKDDKGRTIISPYRPNCEYEHMYRLIAQTEDYRLTNYVIFTQCVDVQEKDLELWFEVHKDDLETPISQLEDLNNKMKLLHKVGKVVAKQVNDDNIAMELKEFYENWATGMLMNEGRYINYNGNLYKILTTHTSQSNWKPDDSPSLFSLVLTDIVNGAILEWVQPDATNAYSTGDKVLFEGNVYVSLIDNNVWSPTAYPAGWKLES